MSAARFLALVPSRDCVSAAARRRQALFDAGCAGVWSFPALIPLARLSAPLSRAALKQAACTIRGCAPADGFFRFEAPAHLVTSGISVFGRALAEDSSRLLNAALTALPGAAPCPQFVFVLGCVPPEERAAALMALEPETFAFRAAFCANFIIEPLPAGERGLSFRWNIGEAAWLPK